MIIGMEKNVCIYHQLKLGDGGGIKFLAAGITFQIPVMSTVDVEKRRHFLWY